MSGPVRKRILKQRLYSNHFVWAFFKVQFLVKILNTNVSSEVSDEVAMCYKCSVLLILLRSFLFFF